MNPLDQRVSDLLNKIASLPDDIEIDPILPVPFVRRHSVAPPTPWTTEIFQRQLGLTIPEELDCLWRQASGLRLGEEINYGQWGLILWSPAKALEQTLQLVADRPEDFLRGDLIIGEFLGDSDLIVIRCDADQSDYSSVFIALPIDSREDWYGVEPSLLVFLDNFLKTPDDKYWVFRDRKERKL